MDSKALYKLSYGLFLIGVKADGKENGCIVNTVIQVASNPTRVSLACINGNLTPEMIKKAGCFTVSILDKDANFPLFQNFGMQHGTEADKFAGYEVFHDANGMPFVRENCTALLSCRVVETHDLGSHTLFIAEVEDAETVSGKEPVLYNDYQTKIKPRPQAVDSTKKIKGWRCKICGYVYEGAELPADYTCPLCAHPKDDFEPIYE